MRNVAASSGLSFRSGRISVAVICAVGVFPTARISAPSRIPELHDEKECSTSQRTPDLG